MSATPSLADKVADARRTAENERRWYIEHGGSLAGYIEMYGDPGHSACAGDGGTAIHAADLRALATAEARLAALEDQHWFAASPPADPLAR